MPTLSLAIFTSCVKNELGTRDDHFFDLVGVHCTAWGTGDILWLAPGSRGFLFPLLSSCTFEVGVGNAADLHAVLQDRSDDKLEARYENPRSED